jgi:ParB-like chromosome segregation protein Spo0J
MRELERRYYDPSNYSYLRRVIERDGFKECYPIRVIRNKKKEGNEVFDGIHRWKVAKDLGIVRIPAIDETNFCTRPMAVAEGIKANKSHANYNPIDVALNLKGLSENIKDQTGKMGRPSKFHLHELSKQTGMGYVTIQEYLSLLKLPDDIVDLIGTGKLRMGHGIQLLRLAPKFSSRIPSLGSSCYKDQWSVRQLSRTVDAILKGQNTDMKVCQCCRRAYDYRDLNRLELCSFCSRELRELSESKKQKPETFPERLWKRHCKGCQYVGNIDFCSSSCRLKYGVFIKHWREIQRQKEMRGRIREQH